MRVREATLGANPYAQKDENIRNTRKAPLPIGRGALDSAETAGFEPACRLPDNLISSQARYGLFDTSPCEGSAPLTLHVRNYPRIDVRYRTEIRIISNIRGLRSKPAL